MVSVIIPVFNRKRFIGDAIASVLGQSYRNIEVIVIDDGSTDGTRGVVESFRDDRRLCYRYQENSGKPSVVRNRALSLARGEYVCFLDSDDILSSDSIERRLEVLRSNPDVGAVCADWLDFRGNFSRNKLVPSYILRGQFLEKLPEALVKRRFDDVVVYGHDFIYEMFYTNVIKTSTVMVRRKLLDEEGHFDETMTIGEDCELWMRLGNRTHFAYILSPLCYARSHDENITRDRLRNFAEDAKVLQKFLRGHVFHSEQGKNRFYTRIAEFYFDGGWHLYNVYRVDEAKERFRQALRYKPSLRHLRYAVISHLPIATIRLARQVKRKVFPPVSPEGVSEA